MASPTTLTAAETLAASATVSVLGLHGACDPPHRRPAPAHQPAPHEPVSAPVDAAFHIGGPAQLRSESGRAADNEFFKLAEKEHRLTKMMEKEARAEQEVRRLSLHGVAPGSDWSGACKGGVLCRSHRTLKVAFAVRG